ncbi:MAG: hypothetical protein II969_08370 [Anaerolineaceae bacterium]|nr:hypothetical protein [Anaerolineaceae bacterium]
MKNMRDLFPLKQDIGLIREFDDNYYDKIRVYKSRYVTDIESASDYALLIRSDPRLHISQIFFEDLQLREEEHALPVLEDGDISDDLLLAYIRSSDIDIVKFVGEYNGKRIEIGIRKNEWEVWLRIWHLTGIELDILEDELGLT